MLHPRLPRTALRSLFFGVRLLCTVSSVHAACSAYFFLPFGHPAADNPAVPGYNHKTSQLHPLFVHRFLSTLSLVLLIRSGPYTLIQEHPLLFELYFVSCPLISRYND